MNSSEFAGSTADRAIEHQGRARTLKAIAIAATPVARNDTAKTKRNGTRGASNSEAMPPATGMVASPSRDAHGRNGGATKTDEVDCVPDHAGDGERYPQDDPE